MITNFFYWIEDIFNAFFKILPYIGRLGNTIFILIGFIGTIYWLFYMSKNKEKKREVR